jgi:hypothetical protein
VAVGDQLSAGGSDDVDPGLFGVMTVWTLLIPAALFFFGAGMLFPLATSGAMEPFPFLAGTAGALVGGLQNIGSGALAWLSAMMPQTGQASLGLLMTLMGLLILLCWLPLASRVRITSSRFNRMMARLLAGLFTDGRNHRLQ